MNVLVLIGVALIAAGLVLLAVRFLPQRGRRAAAAAAQPRTVADLVRLRAEAAGAEAPRQDPAAPAAVPAVPPQPVVPPTTAPQHATAPQAAAAPPVPSAATPPAATAAEPAQAPHAAASARMPLAAVPQEAPEPARVHEAAPEPAPAPAGPPPPPLDGDDAPWQRGARMAAGMGGGQAWQEPPPAPTPLRVVPAPEPHDDAVVTAPLPPLVEAPPGGEPPAASQPPEDRSSIAPALAAVSAGLLGGAAAVAAARAGRTAEPQADGPDTPPARAAAAGSAEHVEAGQQPAAASAGARPEPEPAGPALSVAPAVDAGGAEGSAEPSAQQQMTAAPAEDSGGPERSADGLEQVPGAAAWVTAGPVGQGSADGREGPSTAAPAGGGVEQVPPTASMPVAPDVAAGAAAADPGHPPVQAGAGGSAQPVEQQMTAVPAGDAGGVERSADRVESATQQVLVAAAWVTAEPVGRGGADGPGEPPPAAADETGRPEASAQQQVTAAYAGESCGVEPSAERPEPVVEQVPASDEVGQQGAGGRPEEPGIAPTPVPTVQAPPGAVWPGAGAVAAAAGSGPPELTSAPGADAGGGSSAEPAGMQAPSGGAVGCAGAEPLEEQAGGEERPAERAEPPVDQYEPGAAPRPEPPAPPRPTGPGTGTPGGTPSSGGPAERAVPEQQGGPDDGSGEGGAASPPWQAAWTLPPGAAPAGSSVHLADGWDDEEPEPVPAGAVPERFAEDAEPARTRPRPSFRTPDERAAEQAAADLALLRTFGFADPGLRPDSAPVVAMSGPEAQPPAPAAGEAQPVRYRVVRRDGSVVGHATVTLLDDRGGDVAAGAADADGRGEVQAPTPGSYVLVSTAPGHQPGAVAITVAAGPVEADVLLARSASVSGTVLGEDGPIAGARVTLVQDGEAVDAVDTDGDGGYRITDIGAGEYGLSVAAAGCEPTAGVLEVDEEAELHHDVELVPASPVAESADDVLGDDVLGDNVLGDNVLGDGAVFGRL